MSEIIKISDEDIKKCNEFANEVVTETYNRFHQNKKIRTERIFYGKLGEVIFLKFLQSKGIFPDVDDMFKVFSGETNVDKFDFITLHDYCFERGFTIYPGKMFGLKTFRLCNLGLITENDIKAFFVVAKEAFKEMGYHLPLK